MLARTETPLSFELCQAIGKVMGVLPNILKSYPLWVYFQKRSASTTRNLPKACCTPALNWLRNPGRMGAKAWLFAPLNTALIVGFWDPRLERIKFSLYGVAWMRE